MANYKYSITIPDLQVMELVNVFGASWPETVLDAEGKQAPNPQSRNDFALRQLDLFIRAKVREKVVEHRRREAARAVDTTFKID